MPLNENAWSEELGSTPATRKRAQALGVTGRSFNRACVGAMGSRPPTCADANDGKHNP